MISPVTPSAAQFHAPERTDSLDALTQRRVEEGRQLALAATRAKLQEQVRMAVAAHMKLLSADEPASTASLPQAQTAYGEF
jgi:hypothetical protein